MQQRLMLVAAAAALAGSAASQSNTVVGLDGNLSDIGNPTVWGRRGAPKPFGEIGFSSSNTMCNPGSVPIPWFAKPATNHPKFGFMMARLTDDRMVQISDRSMCKHAFLSLNSNNGACLPCSQPNQSGNQMWVGCSDVYSNVNNGNRNDLGPADEIDPWLGTWTMVGSYFDRGDPDVGLPGNQDGAQSPISAPDQVKNRVTVQEQDLVVPNSTFFYQIHLLHEGEAVANRNNNLRNRGVAFTSTTTTAGWTVANVGASASGSVLTRWTGATVTEGRNGNDDGRMEVAVKVTGPNNGLWHYEYAVHNLDNSRGGASLRIPICSAARVQNLGFRDIDSNALNQWIATVAGGQISWTAPGDNPLNWNMLFNFWFDSDAAPAAGSVTFDEARIGAGALSFGVTSTVPAFVPNVYLGDGCGSPTVTLAANGVPSAPNPGYALQVATGPSTVGFLFAGAALSSPAGGCTIYLDLNGLQFMGSVLTDGAGSGVIPLPVPAGTLGEVGMQLATLVPGAGAFLADFNLSNGLLLRVGLSDCP